MPEAAQSTIALVLSVPFPYGLLIRATYSVFCGETSTSRYCVRNGAAEMLRIVVAITAAGAIILNADGNVPRVEVLVPRAAEQLDRNALHGHDELAVVEQRAALGLPARAPAQALAGHVALPGAVGHAEQAVRKAHLDVARDESAADSADSADAAADVDEFELSAAGPKRRAVHEGAVLADVPGGVPPEQELQHALAEARARRVRAQVRQLAARPRRSQRLQGGRVRQI